jgi:hypothetical protein
LAAAFALRSTRLFLCARRLLLGAIRRSLAGLATASTPAASATATLLGLGGIARFRGRGRYRLFGFGLSPLGGGLRLGWARSAPKPLKQEKSFLECM